jgi:Uma2 family endonuclease
MATVLRESGLSIAELAERLGGIPRSRIRRDPVPGTATERDILAIHARERRLCELIDGTLVDKPMGYEESLVAVELIRFLANFVRKRKLGLVAGEGGMLKLVPGLVRIPDVSFVAFDRLPGRKLSGQPIPHMAPNLAVEVLSKSNTKREMERKLVDYFDAGVELVWFINPKPRTVEVVSALDDRTLLKVGQTLTGGAVLPGFKLKLRDLFAVLDGR